MIPQTDVVSRPETPEFTVVVPAGRLVKAKGNVSVTADIGKAVYQVTCVINGVTTTDTIEDSYFPDILRLFSGVNLAKPQKPAYFNFALIEKLGKATRALTGKGPNDLVKNVLHQRGQSAAVLRVEDHPDFIGLIMPLSSSFMTPLESLPAWLPA